MTLHDYQRRALDTAKPEAFSHDYLLPGIIGEVGELFGQKAKAHWHGLSDDELNAHLAKEFGDICWMTAVLLSTYQIDVEVDVPGSVLDGVSEDSLWLALLEASVDFQRLYCGDEPDGWDLLETSETAHKFWFLLQYSCYPITGHPFETVLKMNLDKLAARAARGTLIGRGDDR